MLFHTIAPVVTLGVRALIQPFKEAFNTLTLLEPA